MSATTQNHNIKNEKAGDFQQKFIEVLLLFIKKSFFLTVKPLSPAHSWSHMSAVSILASSSVSLSTVLHKILTLKMVHSNLGCYPLERLWHYISPLFSLIPTLFIHFTWRPVWFRLFSIRCHIYISSSQLTFSVQHIGFWIFEEFCHITSSFIVIQAKYEPEISRFDGFKSEVTRSPRKTFSARRSCAILRE